jgi:hypothetical protein
VSGLESFKFSSCAGLRRIASAYAAIEGGAVMVDLLMMVGIAIAFIAPLLILDWLN